MPTTSSKSIIGAEKKNERAKIKQILELLKGKTIKTLNSNDRDELLVILCILLGLSDKNGVIK